MTTILLMEPRPEQREMLRSALEKAGYGCICASSPTEITDDSLIECALAIINTRIKWSECVTLLGALHRQGCTALFLARDRSNEAHLKALYRSGCAVLSEPYDIRSFLGTVSSLIRASETMLTHGAIQLDKKHRLVLFHGERLPLTAQEYQLLRCLMEACERPVTREELLRDAWGYASVGETRTVDVHVQRLRQKLGAGSIETVYRQGYRLSAS